MEKERILEILKNAKNRYIHDRRRHEFGMCKYIDAEFTLVEMYELDTSGDYRYISQVIPEFNAKFLGSNNLGSYWWNKLDSESRIKAFDKLIAIYEKDNTVCKTNE